MLNKKLLVALSFCFAIHSIGRCNYPDDPLRGASFNNAFVRSDQVLVLKIDRAWHGIQNSECEYDYRALVLKVYKISKNEDIRAGTYVVFSSVSRFKIDDQLLIMKGYEDLRSHTARQNVCLAMNSIRSEKPLFLVRSTESLEILEDRGKRFIFLPYRHFWSEAEKATVREQKISKGEEKYANLRMLDGVIDGAFYDFDLLMQEATKIDPAT